MKPRQRGGHVLGKCSDIRPSHGTACYPLPCVQAESLIDALPCVAHMCNHAYRLTQDAPEPDIQVVRGKD
jgi:hypothetical protein